MQNKVWKFPAGEIGVQLQDPPENKTQQITLELKSAISDDILGVMMECDAYHRAGYHNIHLYMSYVPYGRQDRVTTPGTSFSLKVFVDILGTLPEFQKITVVDPHSEESVTLLKKICKQLVVIHTAALMLQMREFFESFKKFDPQVASTDWVVVAPDKGAAKRAFSAANELGIEDGNGSECVVYAEKIRDPATGAITELRLIGDVSGKHVLVVDDICDGGYTFIELAKVLQGAKSTTLFVAHGIFSQGYDAVLAHYDAVYTTDSFRRQNPHNVPPEVILPISTDSPISDSYYSDSFYGDASNEL